MHRRATWALVLTLAASGVYAQQNAGGSRGGTETAARPAQTMKPLVRGTQYAATALMPQAALAAERILHDGGNAFDAIVAGEAVLGVVQPSANGLGSDAQLLIYDAKAKKVGHINAEGTAPKLATIEWYKTHNGGKLPVDDGLLSGTVPGVVDAWYIMLSRWGTKSFADCWRRRSSWRCAACPSARRPEFPRLADAIPQPRSSIAPPDGKAWHDGSVVQNPDLARTLRRLVEAEKEALPKGRLAGLKAARDRFYKGDIAREMAQFSEENGGLFRYEDFANYTARWRSRSPPSIAATPYTRTRPPAKGRPS